MLRGLRLLLLWRRGWLLLQLLLWRCSAVWGGKAWAMSLGLIREDALLGW